MLRERGLRVDSALAAALTVIGVAITLGPDTPGGSVAGALLIPAVTLPVLWRRREPLLASLALGAGIVLSGLPTFDLTRCAVAIPAALLVLFSLGARAELLPALGGLAAVLAGLGVLLVTDPALDGGGGVFLPIAAAVWAAGRYARTRTRLAAELDRRMRELERTREASAALAVDLDRARLASALDVGVREQVRSIVELAAAAERRELQAVPAFHAIETEGRACLDEVRELLGVLRSDGHAVAPRPTLAQLEALVGRRGGALGVEGRRRALPAGVELAAYRTIELALEAFAGRRAGRRPVALPRDGAGAGGRRPAARARAGRRPGRGARAGDRARRQLRRGAGAGRPPARPGPAAAAPGCLTARCSRSRRRSRPPASSSRPSSSACRRPT